MIDGAPFRTYKIRVEHHTYFISRRCARTRSRTGVVRGMRGFSLPLSRSLSLEPSIPVRIFFHDGRETMRDTALTLSVRSAPSPIPHRKRETTGMKSAESVRVAVGTKALVDGQCVTKETISRKKTGLHWTERVRPATREEEISVGCMYVCSLHAHYTPHPVATLIGLFCRSPPSEPDARSRRFVCSSRHPPPAPDDSRISVL